MHTYNSGGNILPVGTISKTQFFEVNQSKKSHNYYTDRLAIATPAAATELGVAFEWRPTKKYFDSKSPPFTITKVPPETRTLTFRMVDRNAPSYNHGGGKVAYRGESQISYGAFRYKGPCPPSGSHTYSWTIKALDAKGKTVAEGKSSKKFPQWLVATGGTLIQNKPFRVP